MLRDGKVTVAFFLVGVLIGATVSYAYYGLRTPVTETCPSGSNVRVKSTNFSPNLFLLIANGLNDRPPGLSQFEFYEEFPALFSATNFGSNSTRFFDFEFPAHAEFNPEMYAGNSSQAIWSYPSQMSLGVQGGLLLSYVQILNLYGSPYGNQSNRGSNYLTMLFHSSVWSFGLGVTNAMISAPFNSTLSIWEGSPVRTPDGFYVYNSLNFRLPNLTYYAGPPDYYHTLGSGTYYASSTVNETGYLWSVALITGSFSRPLMTRYLFAVNMTRIPMAVKHCLILQTMLNLTSTSPFATAATENFQVTDNFPTHSVDGPLNYTNYLSLSIER